MTSTKRKADECGDTDGTKRHAPACELFVDVWDEKTRKKKTHVSSLAPSTSVNAWLDEIETFLGFSLDAPHAVYGHSVARYRLRSPGAFGPITRNTAIGPVGELRSRSWVVEMEPNSFAVLANVAEYAASQGNLEVMRECLEKKLDLQEHGAHLLCTAAMQGRADMLRLLIEHKAPLEPRGPDACNLYSIPICCASINIDSLRRLLRAGATITPERAKEIAAVHNRVGADAVKAAIADVSKELLALQTLLKAL